MDGWSSSYHSVLNRYPLLSGINIGDGGISHHPIHLHGHAFQVAGIFYGEYDENGTRTATNPDITCNQDPSCTAPRWTSTPAQVSITNKTVCKDTIVIPAGGYVVICFVADNWGYWHMHCHTQPHFLEGMVVVINEVPNYQNPPPEEQAMFHCGNFNWTMDTSHEILGHRGGALCVMGRLGGVDAVPHASICDNGTILRNSAMPCPS